MLGPPCPNNKDNNHYRQRGTNTYYGVYPGLRYLFRRWDVDYGHRLLFHHYRWRWGLPVTPRGV